MSKNQEINSRDGFNESVWQAGVDQVQRYSTADANQLFDTLIIGGGITGLTTALLLQKAGQKCIVLEAANIGFGTTGGTSAHLNTFFDATYPEIESDFGESAAKLAADSGREAFEMITSLINEYHIDCDFEYKKGYLYAENEKETKQLDEILVSSKRAGIAAGESETNDVPITFEKAIVFENQGQFHPLKYITALAKAFIALGGTILEDTFVEDSNFKDGIHEIITGDQTFKATNLVYATHIPPGITSFSFRCAPYRSYVLGVKLKDNNYPTGLVYDMQEPYHYFRTHEIEGQKYLIIGGEDHKTGHDDPQTAFDNMIAYVHQYYDVEEITYKWSAQYYVPADGLPYIGHLSKTDRTYMATGFNGNGMMFGTLSARIISDQILGIKSKYENLYSPSRIKPMAAFSEFVKENADVAYHFIADRFSAEELDSVGDLKNGEGKVAELNGKKVAIHKDFNGKVTALSPVCTHAGCYVDFNAAEQSWDCPCHGGRFDTNGKVITGPPRKDLAQLNVDTVDQS